MFNVDRWAAYTLQRLHPNKPHTEYMREWSGYYLPPTRKQFRRMKKKRRAGDTSIGMTLI